MKYLRLLLIFVALSGLVSVKATPPIEFNAAVRNAHGHAVADMPVKFMLEIVDKASGGTVIYGEKQSAVTDRTGMALLMVGEGDVISGDYDAIDWSAPRFLVVKVDVEGSGSYRSLGTLQLLGAPLAQTAGVASTLVRTAPSGNKLELTVNEFGELSWKSMENPVEPDVPSGPNYDQSKVPAQLYYIGNFNNWNVAEAVEMTKLSATKFTIDRHLTPGEIFKFVPTQSWGSLDWSGTEMKIGVPVPLRELLDTPTYEGEEGDFTITVDFYTFTMLITKK